MNTVFLGLGSNLGEKEKNILKAYELIIQEIGEIKKRSSFYYSEAWGFESENIFVNSVIEVNTLLTPQLLLIQLKSIEAEIGRKYQSIGSEYTDRMIDLDILFYNHDIIKNEQLTIPHPFLHRRLFVLVPLNEIAENFIHPELKLTVKTLLSSIKI